MDHRAKTNSYETQTPTNEPGRPSANVASRTCHNYWCNYTTGESLDSCPKCGRALITPQTFKLLGWALLFLGGLLAVGAVALVLLVAPRLPDVRGGLGARLLILGVLGSLLAVGLTFMMSGLWQVFYSKRSQSLTTFGIVLLIALSIIVAIGRAVL